MTKYIISRTLAAAMDYGIFLALVTAYVRLFGELTEERYYRAEVYPHLPSFVGLWIVTLPLPEALWGQGIGKSLVGLKVTMRGNYSAKPNLAAVAKRQLAALLEIAMSFGILPVIVILFTPARQRLGDLWAGTVVVSEDLKSPDTGSATAHGAKNTDAPRDTD